MGRYACASAISLFALGGDMPAFAQPGDADVLAYGEYLAGECTTCHRIDGTDNGIPAIIGWPHETFIAVMTSYKQGERENKTMISVARSLDEEQLNALATYFSSLKRK